MKNYKKVITFSMAALLVMGMVSCGGDSGSGDSDIIAAGFDPGTPPKAAVADGTMFGDVTQCSLGMGNVTILPDTGERYYSTPLFD